jgi:SAM-dependent methyltransferase
MNFRQLAYGILSVIPGIPESLYKGTGGTDSAEYCYCIWLRHLVLANSLGMDSFPRAVGELGPGDSIGVGMAALLSGAQRYVALDATEHADPVGSLPIFDALVELFRARTPIPGREAFPEIALDLPDNSFPVALLPEAQLQAALSDERVGWLRRIFSGERPEPETVDYRAPWGVVQRKDAGSIDFLLSNAVMEHVADLPDAYASMARWLRPGGFASHQIDFRSHGLFRAWDGHWACPDWLWQLFIGRRPYLLNREPFATHRKLAGAAGLDDRAAIRLNRPAETTRLAKRFRTITAEDRTTCGGYLLLQKPLA